MTNLLIKLFIKDYENPDDPKTREKYGVLSGIVGIVLNVLLAAAKFSAGILSNSISITADAVNNFSDAGSSAVTLAGFKAAGKPADKEHPFGHGRMEYIAALIVSFIVLLFGLELIKSSIDKIIHPVPSVFSYTTLTVLLISIAAKLWLAFFNRTIGKRIHSLANKAVVLDSLSDIAATTVTIIALVCSMYTTLPVDGYMGVVVALFILYTGFGIIKDTIGPLLGETPDPAVVQEIEKEILSYEGVVGVHDLVIHCYGPGRLFASAHAEVPADVDVMKSHDTIDLIERSLLDKYGVLASIHMDPIVTNDAHIARLREEVCGIVTGMDHALSIHDFRVVEGPTHTNLIFDLVTPYEYPLKAAELAEAVDCAVKQLNPAYYTVITVENSFI